MAEFHSTSKLLQDILIGYTRTVYMDILTPIQVHTGAPCAVRSVH